MQPTNQHATATTPYHYALLASPLATVSFGLYFSPTEVGEAPARNGGTAGACAPAKLLRSFSAVGRPPNGGLAGAVIFKDHGISITWTERFKTLGLSERVRVRVGLGYLDKIRECLIFKG